jgi:hypothetical protein
VVIDRPAQRDLTQPFTTAAIVSLAPALLVAGVVIGATWGLLMPGVGFWDTGEFQTVLPIMGTAHPTGYPTYVLVGWLANILLTPLGEPAFRMNVLSLLAVALACGTTVLLVRRLSGSTAMGVLAGFGLAFTPVVWRIATHADPHALHLAMVAVVLALLVRWEWGRRASERTADRWLVAASIAFGLAVGNHSLTLLLAIPIGLYVLAVHPRILREPRLAVTCAAAVVLSVVVVYLELPLRAGPFRAPLVYANPSTWDGFWYIALAEQFRGSLIDPLGHLPEKAAQLISLAVTQFGILAPLIPVGFLATLSRAPRYALLTGLAMLITTIFDASYVNADIDRYYLGPALWAWTWIGVLGGVIVEQVADGSDRSRLGVGRWLRPALAALLAIALVVPTVLAFEARRTSADRHADSAAAAWLDRALPPLAKDAVVVSWWSASTPLWYAQFVETRRTDLFIVDDRTRLDLDLGEATDVIARYLATRPVYVIRANDHDLGLVTALYRIAPVPETVGSSMIVYRVLGAKAGS